MARTLAGLVVLVGRGVWKAGKWTPWAARFAYHHPYVAAGGAAAAYFPGAAEWLAGQAYQAAGRIVRFPGEWERHLRAQVAEIEAARAEPATLALPPPTPQPPAPVAPRQYPFNPYFLR